MPTTSLDSAVHCLQQNGLIAYPTEAVFGLGCNPSNESAVQRLLALKQRSADKGLLLIAANIEQLLDWANIPAESLTSLRHQWPASTTYLFNASPNVPRWITGTHAKIAVRVTTHPVAAALCQRFGGALVSTSANISGQLPARTATEVAHQLGAQLDAIVPGECDPNAKPSTIIDFASGAIIRQ